MTTFLVKCLLWFNLTNFHPFFVSMVDINHNTKDQLIEISTRIFKDDLETTLKKFSNQPLDIVNPKNKEALDKIIMAYLQKNLQIGLDDKPYLYNYVGYEIIKESIWIYVEIPNINQFKKISVNCHLLHDFNKQQINIVHVKKQQQEKSYKLDYPNSYVSFSF
jgi:hypothetical protein